MAFELGLARCVGPLTWRPCDRVLVVARVPMICVYSVLR